MARNNDVFQVLVTKGDHEVLKKGEKVTDLLPGQIGVFNFDTNLAIDGDVPTRNFYLAVGIDKDGDGITDDVAKSRGSHIQTKNIAFYSYRPHTASRPMKVVLKNYTAECETEYGIRLELRNQEIYRTQGYNQFTKYYSIVTACCDGCEPTCPSGDGNEITRLLYLTINGDPSKLVSAKILPRGDVSAAGVTPVNGYLSLADLATIMAYNATLTDVTKYVYTDLEITPSSQGIKNFCQINLGYFYPRETVAFLTKIEGFKCNGAVEVTQQAAFEEGSGYDIKQLEYKSLGWDVSPYRVSSILGVADERSYNTVVTEKYNQIALTYDQFSLGGWLEYLNNEATVIAIPASQAKNTQDSLLRILDKLLKPNGFDELLDDAAIADPDPTVVEPTTTIDNVDEDGIA